MYTTYLANMLKYRAYAGIEDYPNNCVARSGQGGNELSEAGEKLYNYD